MKFQALDWDTQAVLFEADTRDELVQQAEYQNCTDYNLVVIHECRACGKDNTLERHDHYGITTGHWCEDCYENDYPYRKDEYDPYNLEGTR